FLIKRFWQDGRNQSEITTLLDSIRVQEEFALKNSDFFSKGQKIQGLDWSKHIYLDLVKKAKQQIIEGVPPGALGVAIGGVAAGPGIELIMRERIADMIKKLNSRDSTERQNASKALAEMARYAAADLQKAAAQMKNLEMQRRAQAILERYYAENWANNTKLSKPLPLPSYIYYLTGK